MFICMYYYNGIIIKVWLVILPLNPISMKIFVLEFCSRNRLLYSYSCAGGINKVVGVSGLIKNKNCRLSIQDIRRLHL